MKDLSQPTAPTISTIDVDNEKLRNMMAIWLINRQRPLVTVEDPELIEIFKYLNPTAELVKADAIKNIVMELYTSGKQELKVSFIIIFYITLFLCLQCYRHTSLGLILKSPLHRISGHPQTIKPSSLPRLIT